MKAPRGLSAWHRALLCFLFFIFGSYAGAESFMPGFAPVRNFSRQSYGAGPQNWDVSQDSDGRVYFANRDGLLKFDGVRWSLFRLPNFSTVRAVYAGDAEGRVFVGGSGEFGYFQAPASGGAMEYVSWSASLPASERDFSEIWNIRKAGTGTYLFQGDYRLFIGEGKNMTVVRSEEKITASNIIGGEIFVGLQSGGVCRLAGSSLIPVCEVPSVRIAGLLPAPGGNGVLIVTAAKGLFLYNKGRVEPYESEINGFLSRNQTFSATFSDGFYAFGTVDHGAVAVNFKSGETFFINRDTGLQDNTVLGLGFDFSGNLWLCLDNGIGYALVNSTVFNLLGNSSDAGAGYASLRRDCRLFLATNRGLFVTQYPFNTKEVPPALTKLHGGQVWSLDSIGEEIFVSADDGLYLLRSDSDRLLKIEGLTGGNWTVSPLKSRPGFALASSYDGFYLLENAEGNWRGRKVEGFSDAGGNFFENTDGSIWIAHWMKGVYRLVPSSDFSRFTDVRLFTSKDGLPNERDNSLALYDGDIIISTASGEFFRPAPGGGLERDAILSAKFPLSRPAHFYSVSSDISFALSPESVWKFSTDSNGKTIVDSVSFRRIAGSLVPGFEHLGSPEKNLLFISNQEGFHSLNLDAVVREGWKNGVLIESLTANDSVIFAGVLSSNLPEVSLPYSLNSLSFQFAAPEFRDENAVLYSCMLENYDDAWSPPSEAASKEYTRLHEGTYTLRVRAYNTVTGQTAETAYTFTILPPWYRSTAAKIAYVILIVLALFGGIRLFLYLSRRNARKVRRQKEAEMEIMRKESEKEALKKDYEIASLKSDQLERDIKHKSSELSNATMNVIRKNEILLDISSMLARLHDKALAEGHSTPGLKKELDKIQSLIQENISHDDDWKKFNQNFDIVYENFTRNLSERFPDLTLSERRLCCYLRMGLSSKEIAPIFSISPKSVEMNRYRLRRKMGLDRDVNLVEYLQQI